MNFQLQFKEYPLVSEKLDNWPLCGVFFLNSVILSSDNLHFKCNLFAWITKPLGPGH